MDRFAKWSTIELKLMLQELEEKKDKSEEDLQMIEGIKSELAKRNIF